jgi:amidohydrolase
MTPIHPITLAEIQQRAQTMQPQLREWRHIIHRYPELSFTEVQTARLVTSVLHELGIEAETGVAKTGVVGHIEGGSGPTIGLRADMDALSIQEENGTDFDSERPGLMHACGHDAHTAILMGAATLLKSFADEGRLPGNVRLLFQPSEEARDEENKSGGMRLVDEGALANLDAVFGLHVDAAKEVGKVGTMPGAMMAGSNTFDLTIWGFGGHGARPHMANDPILLAAQVVQTVNQIISRRIDPLSAGVISICTIHAGTANNVIPDKVELSGTIRSMTTEVQQLLHEELRKACSVVEPLGGRFELNLKGGYPPLINDATAAQMALTTLGEMLGSDKAEVQEPMMASEDFSYMLRQAPGCFLRLGVKNPAWDRVYPVHTPTFRIDEEALAIGTASLAAMTVRWMQEHA